MAQGVPHELYVGLWVDQYKRTPLELGLAKKNDIALMARAQRAVFIYQTARMAQDREAITRLSRPQLELIEHMRELVKKMRPKKKRVRGIVRRRRRG